MGEVEAQVTRARDAHRQVRWDEACEAFLAADRAGGLAVEDVERLAEAAQLTGRHDDAVPALERAFAARVTLGEPNAAATAAFWAWQACLLDGEMGRDGGWLARLEDLGATTGWLRVARTLMAIARGRYDDALNALGTPEPEADTDIEAFTLLLAARARLKAGQVVEGLARLDAAMLGVVAGKTSPRVTALLYCAAIGNCEEEAHDLARAQEWACALEKWLAGLPTPSLTGPFLANCRVYRAVLMRRRGDWAGARSELETAVAELTGNHGAMLAGHACYELGESHRLLGDAAAAERCYRQAVSLGGSTQPGLSLLRLAQGDVAAAAGGVRRALAEADRAPDRARLLPGYVEVMLAARDVGDAAEAVTEIGRIAGKLGTSSSHAEHDGAAGRVALAEGRAADALSLLRRAATTWRELCCPYETAVTGVLVGSACRAVGDDEGAGLEREAARETFAQLGAVADLAALDAGGTAHGLTDREQQVLGLVARGLTNRGIASELFLSERTVHRHVSNILAKLGVASRTEAATYAVRHDLVPPGE
jgi:DNA-binding CsgD family transcriptional regulator